MTQWTIHATAAFGLEAVVKRQCEALGFGPCRIEEGHVLFPGTCEDVMRANLYLASADRVLLEVGRFRAESFDALFEATKALDWTAYLPRDARFPVRAKTVQSQLASPSDVQKLVKKAVVTALQRRDALEHFPEDGALYPIDVTIRHDECVVCMDTTGEGLFKRGYRREKGGAPLKETLAAALVDLSVWTPDRPFADVFCGSGTLVIEAARKARGIAPGLDRSFLFLDWPWMDAQRYKELRREALSRVKTDLEADMLGFDIDPTMVRIARHNAEEAGVSDMVHFVTRDMREVGLRENFGVLVTNPPYGKRLSPVEGVEELMCDFARRFLTLRTWSIYVLTVMPDFEKRALQEAGKEATRRRKLFNGGEQTTYYQFLGPDPKRFR
ncbi:THUMP domain-containing class I SAM-dependent RNA methyltransferase [Murdochiella vaginalis]|uniref:THUMP domain-containing class I SAM-dependent RNA methyltransferase n=1 Tax=Murdochiella vaginalis TaxID=1852373 RepID=UPI0008FE6204|nr:class I SAM-dependent RNA methyltransferase [Murdochiella vaginalis]